jgi:site-specific DNA-cytosine methylase
MTTKRILELFCGTKSVGKVFESAGYEVVSLDYNKKFNATFTEDILTWDYMQYPSGYFDVIWSSPDCSTWSLASGGKYRTKVNIYGLDNDYQTRATIGNNMILRVIEILKYFKPRSWFIENPKALLTHFPPLKDFIKESNGTMNLVYYANYNNWGFPKPTNIWSNHTLWENEPKPVMHPDSYIVRHHPYNNRDKKYYKSFWKGTDEDRSKIPPDLITRLRLLIPNEV